MFSFRFFRKKNSNGRGQNSEGDLESLRQQLDLLIMREQVLTTRSNKETENAKLFLKQGKKDKAAQCLKTKKTFSVQLQRLKSQIANTETLMMKIEEAQIDVEVFKANQIAKNEIKKVYKDLTRDKVEEQFEDLQETIHDAEDISQALSQPIETESSADVDDELALLENEILGHDLEQVLVNSESKKQPEKKEPTRTDSMDKELETLQQQILN